MRWQARAASSRPARHPACGSRLPGATVPVLGMLARTQCAHRQTKHRPRAQGHPYLRCRQLACGASTPGSFDWRWSTAARVGQAVAVSASAGRVMVRTGIATAGSMERCTSGTSASIWPRVSSTTAPTPQGRPASEADQAVYSSDSWNQIGSRPAISSMVVPAAMLRIVVVEGIPQDP